MANYKGRISRFKEYAEELELDRLIEEIEDKQSEQIELLNSKEVEIKDLMDENSRLQEIIAKQQNEIDLLRGQIGRLNERMYSIEQMHRNEMNQAMTEVYSLIEINKKIDEQNKEIMELEKVTDEQLEQLQDYMTDTNIND